MVSFVQLVSVKVAPPLRRQGVPGRVGPGRAGSGRIGSGEFTSKINFKDSNKTFFISNIFS